MLYDHFLSLLVEICQLLINLLRLWVYTDFEVAEDETLMRKQKAGLEYLFVDVRSMVS